MNYETNRLNTFTNWPSSAPIDPIRVAKAGFYCTGEGTEVKCFCCGIKVSQWNPGDQAMWRHREAQPNCPFIVHPEYSGNVPLILGPVNSPRAPSVPPEDVQNEHNYSTVPDYGVTEEDETYRNDALRLLSFINWDDSSVSRQALVNAGFYHAGEGRLRCAWCGGELIRYNHFGRIPPIEVHRMYFPRCQHAAAIELAQQVELAQQADAMISAQSSPSLSISPGSDTDSPPQSPERSRPQTSGAAHNERVLNESGTWRNLGVVGGGARHPQYASLAARLASYDRWPADRQQAPRALAEAGFFHTGTDDQVRCFYCDGGLGKWEANDTPWSEHAHWFPHCGYVLLVKGQEYVDSCRNRTSQQHTVSFSDRARGRSFERRNFSITESQVEECMESTMAAAALGAGLDAARVRRAIANRLRQTGTPFMSSEALIDAVLDDQLQEEPWQEEMSPRQSRLARDILTETFRDFAERALRPPPYSQTDGDSDSDCPAARSMTPDEGDDVDESFAQVDNSQATSTRNTTNTGATAASVKTDDKSKTEVKCKPEDKSESENKDASATPKLSLEEENRQLKEARLCKVCMDCEVSVVFLPCGHLVSCARCGAALHACPLCRASVRALVRAYLA